MKSLSFIFMAGLATLNLMQSQAFGFVPQNQGCYAYTYCPSGGYVWCQTFNNPWTMQACTYFVLPGVRVECTGVDLYGRPVDVFFNCY